MNPSFNVNQVVAALNHLSSAHLIISLESNLYRKPPRSNISLLKHILPSLNGRDISSELVPSLKTVITVDNSAGRIDASAYRSFTHFQDVLEEGVASNIDLSSIGLDPDEIANIQFTSGYEGFPAPGLRGPSSWVSLLEWDTGGSI